MRRSSGWRADGAVRQPPQVEGVEVVARGDPLPGAAQGVPGPGVAPGLVGAGHRLAPGALVDALQLAGAARQDAAQAPLDAVDAGCHLAEGAVGPGLDHLPRRRFVHLLRGSPLAVPVAQQAEGFGQNVGHHRVVDAAHQHRPQGGDEGQADEGQKGQDQPRGAQPGAEVGGPALVLAGVHLFL